MNVSSIVSAIDEQIATLQQVRELLSATAVPDTERRAQQAVASVAPEQAAKSTGAKTASKTAGSKRTMSAEGRARIAAAQKKRWALKNAGTATPGKVVPAKKGAVKKTAPVKVSAKKTPKSKLALSAAPAPPVDEPAS